MKPTIKHATIGSIAAIAIVFAIWYVLAGIGYRNREASLRATFNNTMTANRVDYDAAWKIIAQTSQVPTKYSEDFQRAYTAIVAAGGNTDQNAVKNLFAVATGMRPPQLDSSLYRKVQDEVDAQRTKFANAQKDALAIKNEHDTLRTTWPGTWFVGSAKPLEMQTVTSTRTDRAFETGKDDQVDLFGGK